MIFKPFSSLKKFGQIEKTKTEDLSTNKFNTCQLNTEKNDL